MDIDIHLHDDSEDVSAPSPEEPAFTLSSGGMFAGSHNFTLTGGMFNNITNKYLVARTVPRGVQMIPMGDVDLQKELTVNEEPWLVGRRQKHNCVRRVYSATIGGRNLNVTVAVYQGDGAEDDWKRDAQMYMSVRHPNILQIWGGTSYGNIHTTVFHGDLVPLKHFITPHSPIMMVYLYAYYTEQWEQVAGYLASLWQRSLASWNCTMWIRCSTGRLSVDPVPPNIGVEIELYSAALVEPLVTPSAPADSEVLAIESLGLRQYHSICTLYLKQYSAWDDSISTSVIGRIGAVIWWPPGHRYEGHTEIALPAEIDVFDIGWQVLGPAGVPAGNGCMRYRADDVLDTEIWLEAYSHYDQHWLSQANYVFSSLQITSNLEDYALVESVYFIITVGNFAGRDSPLGYLFICPIEDFKTGPTSFRWPDCPAYWSLDHSGVDRLSTEEAARLGFPPFHLATRVRGRCWDTSVYAGLRKFHQAKGFDPKTQDVALHLGEPLYRLSRDVNPVSAHAVKEIPTADEADELNRDEGRDGGPSLNRQATTHGPRSPAFGESPIVSRSFRFIMWIQLTLILFLSLSLLSEQMYL